MVHDLLFLYFFFVLLIYTLLYNVFATHFDQDFWVFLVMHYIFLFCQMKTQ